MGGRRPEREQGGTALRVAGAYALLASIATGLAVALRDGMPWTHPRPWIVTGGARALLLSAALGLVLALIVVCATRLLVARFEWARRLHGDLRPVARDLTLASILLLAGLSSLGEELLFRGLLTPTIGVVPSALVFGFAHQIRGPSRWIWIAWASLMGLALGAIFALTGTLVGALLAHAVINAANLVYLRDYDPCSSCSA
jgi:membrane protease YdiL (CAAX protease family)